MVNLNEKEFKHLENKKFFELTDWTNHKLFKNKIWCYFFKGKKGIGKSYSLNKIFEEVDNSKDSKIMYVRTRRDDLLSAKIGWEENSDICFKIDGKTIISKKTGEVKGRVAYANNLSSLRSGAYKNYKFLIYDEFVEYDIKNYKNYQFFAQTFMKLILDINRDTEDLKVFCFGNNDILFDPFSEYFKIDVQNSKINADFENGILFCNLENFYKGVVEDKKSFGLAFYDNKLIDFLRQNKNYEDLSLYANYSKSENAIVESYFFWNNKYIAFLHSLEDTKLYYLKIANKIIENIPVFCLNEIDYVLCEKAVLLNRMQIAVEINKYQQLIKNRKLKFINSEVKADFLQIINKYAINLTNLSKIL